MVAMKNNAKYNAWAATLTVGTTVKTLRSLIRSPRAFEELHFIEKITPTGFLKLDDGTLVNPSGLIRGSYRDWILPVDGTDVSRTEREKALEVCTQFRNFEEMPDDEVIAVAAIFDKYPIRYLSRHRIAGVDEE